LSRTNLRACCSGRARRRPSQHDAVAGRGPDDGRYRRPGLVTRAKPSQLGSALSARKAGALAFACFPSVP
jgi:hypothetical protein